MTTNLSESFNHILKGLYALHVSSLVQLIFFRTSAYFDKQKDYAYDYITQGKLWPLVVQLELDANILRYRDHTTVLFNIDDGIFQVHTPYKLGVKKEVR
jgi:hypothetical protein